MARDEASKSHLECLVLTANTGHGDVAADPILQINTIDYDPLNPTSVFTITNAGVVTVGTVNAVGSFTTTVPNTGTNTTVRGLYGKVTASGTGKTTGHLSIGTRGEVVTTGTITGNAYFYGAQGKISTSTVTFGTGSQAWVGAIVGQLDMSGVTTYTANVGAITAGWFDCGSAAHANAITAAPTFVDVVTVTNSISTFKPHSMIRVQGDATNFMALSAWDTTKNDTGCDYIVAGGDTTAAAPHALKMLIGSETLYIRLHSVA